MNCENKTFSLYLNYMEGTTVLRGRTTGLPTAHEGAWMITYPSINRAQDSLTSALKENRYFLFWYKAVGAPQICNLLFEIRN